MVFTHGLRSAALSALAASLLAACAQLPSTTSAAPDSKPQPQQAKAPAPKARVEREEPLPKQDLTPQILYKTMLAEIAAQRGENEVAMRTYLELARTTRDPRYARRAAEFGLLTRDMNSSMEAARLWVEFDPGSLQARQTLAGLLVASNRLDEVAPQIQKLLAEEGENVGEALLRLNRLFARQPDKKNVMGLVDKLTEPYLGLAEAHYARAQAAANAELYERAVREVDQALALRPDWEPGVLFKSQVERQTSGEAALATLRAYLAKHPEARDVRLQYARTLVGERRYEDARSEFQRLMKNHPEDLDLAYAIGILSAQLNDYATAESTFKKLIASNYQDSDNVRLYLGQINEDRKRYEEARSWYGQVNPGEHFFTAQVRYANVLAKEGKLDEARNYLKQAQASTPAERTQYQMAEAQILRDNGRVREAFDFLQTQLASQPDQPDLLYEVAMIAEKLDRMDILEANLRKLIQIKPDSAHAYNALGYSLADRGQRLQEARQLIAKALELAPNDAFIMDSMGWVLYREGDSEGALRYLQKAYSTRPDPEIAAHLGEVLWKMGRRDEAERTWREAAKASPDNETLGKVIKQFKR